jgi:glycosyl transferase family 87
MRPPGRRVALAAAGAAVLVLIGAFALEVASRTDADVSRSDVGVYQGYGSRIVGGEVPYRDFALEYPPGALPMFVLPSDGVLTGGSTDGAVWAPLNQAARHYQRGFESLVLVLAILLVCLTAWSLSALRRPFGSLLLSLSVVALAPLLVGDVFPGRFDIWPTVVTAGALALAVRRWYPPAGILLGVGAATKLYPLLLLPVLAIVAFRDRGPRAAIATAAAGVGGALAVFAPFAALSLSGTWEGVRVQFQGGLQIESVASSLLVAASHAARALERFGFPRPSPLTNRATQAGISRSVLTGPGLDATAVVLNVMLVAVLLAVWFRLARSKEDVRDDLTRFSAATVAVVLVLGPVLSPQYMIWPFALVPLVGGRRGVIATLTFALAALITRFWFPAGYVDFENGLDNDSGALLLARNLVLVATALALVVGSNPFAVRRRVP